MIMKHARKAGPKIPAWAFRFFMNCWPPLVGAGISVRAVSPDYRYAKVCLKSRWYNRNYVGTQFGGSIYAMTDPFYMLLLMHNLGTDYIVWDKAAYVDFVSPGRKELVAEFHLTDAIINKVKAKTASGEKYIFNLHVAVLDVRGEVVATVNKTLYVRKKKRAA